MVLRIGNCRRKSRQGYVLIMTLVLIAVAALSLSGLARRSLLVASESVTAQRVLQRYWGTRSCRQLLLDRADEIFLKLEEPHANGQLPWPAPSEISGHVELGGIRFRVWLSDEDAKLNLNVITTRMPEHRQVLLGKLLGSNVTLQLDPDQSSAAKQKKRPFSSLGQVVNIGQIFTAGKLDRFRQLTLNLTCWGSGKLNLFRVREEVLLLIASKLVNQEVAQKLLEARNEATEIDLSNILKTLALRRTQSQKLRSWFTDRSTCFCLWLELDDGQRRWYHQWVQGDRSSTAADSVLSFHW